MNAQDLKNSILQLAIQGKLTHRLDADSSVDEAIKSMKTNREQLIKEKKLRKDGKINYTTNNNELDIPENWRFVLLKEIICKKVDNRGKTPPHSTVKTKGHIDLLEINSLVPGNVVTRENVEKFITKEVYDNNLRGYVEKDDILIATVGSIGKFSLMDASIGAIAQNIIAIRCFEEVDQRYIFTLLQSPYFFMQMNNVTMKAVQASIKVPDLLNLRVPLPPLEEQKRIVAKIEELMPYVDKYDVAHSEVEELNKKFPEDMQKSILQYAIQGKLVEQREEDGTAEDLYKQIQEEKKKLIKEGKIKKTKALPEIAEDEIPFDIPENWKWVRLGDALDIARGGSPRPIKSFITDSEDGVNWIKIGDTDKGGKYINSTNEKIIKEGVKKSRFVKKGDFLLSNSMSFGRPYILNIDGCIHDGWLVLSQRVEVFNKDFLYYLLSSRMVFNQFQSVVSGAVVNNLNSDKVRLTIVPIPPLTEQKRIVEKIEELLPYTNQLVKKVD